MPDRRRAIPILLKPFAGRYGATRGASWANCGDEVLYAAHRHRKRPADQDDRVGFRCVVRPAAPASGPGSGL